MTGVLSRTARIEREIMRRRHAQTVARYDGRWHDADEEAAVIDRLLDEWQTERACA